MSEAEKEQRAKLAGYIDTAIVALQELAKRDMENKSAHEKTVQNMERLFDVTSGRDKVEGSLETSISDITAGREAKRTMLQTIFRVGPRTAYAGYVYKSANVMQT
jgi:hypothetical protein